jgi:hypothetical protein
MEHTKSCNSSFPLITHHPQSFLILCYPSFHSSGRSSCHRRMLETYDKFLDFSRSSHMQAYRYNFPSSKQNFSLSYSRHLGTPSWLIKPRTLACVCVCVCVCVDMPTCFQLFFVFLYHSIWILYTFTPLVVGIQTRALISWFQNSL